jgi:hypothetical protein
MTTTTQSDTLTHFATDPDRLESAVAGLTEDQLNLAEAPGQWSIRQIVHHLADDCDVWSFGIKRGIAVDGVSVRFGPFPGNEPWANALAFERRPIGPALALFRAHRALLAELVSALPASWERCVSAVDDQSQTFQLPVGGALQMLSNHLQEHLATIARIRALHGV